MVGSGFLSTGQGPGRFRGPTRRTIFDLVREQPRSVGELAAKLPVSRPAVSQHLGVLARARLVRHRKRGTRHVYHPDPAGLAPLRAYVESLWEDVLAAFAASGEGNGGSEMPETKSDRITPARK